MKQQGRIKVERINIREAEPGMVLARPVTVFGADGREEMPEGFTLEDKHIRQMRRWGIEEIQVLRNDEDDPGEELYGSSIRMLSKSAYAEAVRAYEEFDQAVLAGVPIGLFRIVNSVTDLLEVIVFESTLLWLVGKLSRQGRPEHRHCVDVCVTSMVLGRHIGMDIENLKMLGLSGILHDVGLRAASGGFFGENLLWGKSPDDVRNHPFDGAQILRGLQGGHETIWNAIEQHHEYRDGSGFPKQLSGDEIPREAAILGISEAFHTLTGTGGAADAVPPHVAMGLILDPGKNRFDGRLMRAFIANIGVYPVGTQVRMNNRSMGVVMSANRDKPLRPRVMIVYDERKNAIRPFVVDLTDVRYAGWYVEETLGEEDMRVRLEEIVFL